MSFLHPTLITGPLLLLLGVPVLIHLIHLLRHRRVQWAAMQFLQQSALRYRKWILFRQSALLLVRIAAVAALLMMLAQPVLQSPWGRLLGGDRTHHVVLLDDSFSMSDQGPTGRVFDLGKRFLVQLTGKLLEQDGTHKLSLLRFSRAVEPSAGPRFDVVQERVDRALYVQLERMLKATDVSQLAVGPAAALRVVARQPRLADDAARIVYLVSDFRTNEWRDATEQRAILAELQRTGARIQLVACADTQRANLAISSVRPATATRAAEVEMLMQVSVRHFGHTAARRVAVRLEQDGQSRPAVVLDEIGPNSTATSLFRVQFPTAGQHTLTAALDPDPVAADNARSTVLDLPEAIPVLLIDPSREGRDAYYLAAALAPGGAVSTGLRPRIEAPSFLRNHAQLNEFAAIYLLNLDRLDRAEIEAVEDYVRAGGGVAFFLGERCNARFFNAELHRDGDGMFPVPLTFPTDLLVDRLDTAADLVVTDHPIFALLRGARNSFLGSVVVERYFAVPTGWAPDPRAATRVIARLRNGAPLVVEQRFGDGRVVAVLTKLAPEDSPQGRWNNWARNNPSFVVTMLELQGYLGRQRDGGRERLVGQPLVVTLDPQQHERTVRFKPPTDQNAAAILVDAEPAGDALQAVLPSTGRSGIYEAQVRGRDGTLARRLFAYNVVAREGDLQMVGQTELAAKLSGVPHSFLHAADTQRDAAALAGVNLSRVVLALLIVLLLIEQLVAHAASYHVLPGGPSR